MKAIIVISLLISLPVFADIDPVKKQRADKIKACFASVCGTDGLTKQMITEMNPSRVFDQTDTRAYQYVNNIIRPILESVVSGKQRDPKVKDWKKRCEDRLEDLKINEKYLVDIEMIQRMKEQTFDFWTDVLSDKTMGRIRTQYQDIQGKCYYQQNLEDMLRSFFKTEVNGLESEMSCSFLDELRLDEYPSFANITSPGDSFIKEESMILFSNDTCLKKDRGEGVMAHEFTHAMTYIFAKYPKKSFTSKRRFRKIRKCLSRNYKERTDSQTAWIRDESVDELTTEEDFADLARFALGKPFYLDGCSNYDFSVRSFSTEEKRYLYRIYDFVGNSNPHSTPIYRLLHELIYHQTPLTAECQEVVDMASPSFKIRKCLK